MKKIVKFRPSIFSRHPSHDYLRRNNKTLPLYNFRTVVRFGSSTPTEENHYKVEINTVEAIKNSANKLRMKTCFTEGGVKTADWWTNGALNDFAAEKYPIVAKHIFGSRGTGNTLINNFQELNQWMQGKTMTNYVFEKFYNYSREYRLHVTSEGCFYTCRKMIKSETPEDKRWFRNDQNSTWILEENEMFDKPVNWDEIVEHSVRALNAVGLDVGACDVKVQSAVQKDGSLRNKCNFIIIEINSAPSFGEITKVKYQEIIPILIDKKLKQ
jgi:carbamoylphosphate synthase large subunit